MSSFYIRACSSPCNRSVRWWRQHCPSRFPCNAETVFSSTTAFTINILKRNYCSSTAVSSPWTEQLVPSHDGTPLNVSLYNMQEKRPDNVVLCLPGALGTGPSDFKALLSGGLGEGFGIVALDPRGLGKSNSVPREYPVNFYQRDALDGAAVMSEFTESYFVMGWSDGANTAIHLAASFAQRVKKLVVWGGNAFVTRQDVEAWEALRDIRNWSEKMRSEKAQIHGEMLQELNCKATDGWIRLYTENAGDVSLWELHNVSCPTMVVHGAKDVICHESHARYIAEQISDAHLAIIAEGKHNLHQRHADTFHQMVRDFFLREEETVIPLLSSNIASAAGTDGKKEPAIDEIAYAFMGSKALSTALRARVFDAIHASCNESSKCATFQDVESLSKVKGERLQTLLSACVSLDLVHRRVLNGSDVFSLPRASAEQLVKSSKHYWGDYIMGQVDGQFYSRMNDLDTILREGTNDYEGWFDSDPEAAKQYTQAQHNGSLATAYALHRRLPELKTINKGGTMRMLDVGGGSGAFSIATAETVPHARCVVMDLPNVVTVADQIIASQGESVRQRVSTVSLSAKDPSMWHQVVQDESFDVVLMSYISGSIPVPALPGLYANAFRALKPGGLAIVHDFFVNNHGDGPRNAALWALAHCTVNPDGMGLRPNRVANLLTEAGFAAPKIESLIPKTTKTIVATKP